MDQDDIVDQQEHLQIAIVGMACRFPGASTLEQYWRNLRDGVESIARLSEAQLAAAGVTPEEYRQPTYVPAAPILDDIAGFDAALFGYTPLEAELMDPQQRQLLECAWEALEHAGYTPERYQGSIGVFAGSRTNSYVLNIVANPQLFKSLGVFQVALGNDLANLATRISYKLDLQGPSYGVHTACSTSLVAVHMACQSLLLDECQMALAGGVAINVPHTAGYLYEEGGVLSPDGHCRPFDAQAAGTLFGSGAGMVVLKRLADAIEDGDTIHAIIRGSATNNDGAVKASFTAPSVDGQMQVILDALAEADLSADSISYVEAHGTGTALGDPIELRALSKAFRASTKKKQFCAIGSVKSNLGHLDAAAGISSLIKTVLALTHRQLPPTLHYQAPNPRIDFASSPFFVNTSLRDWSPPAGLPRRAGVSSFGFGGTNAHVILEEAPALPPSDASPGPQLLLLSANSQSALEQLSDSLAEHMALHPQLSLADVAYTLQLGRKALPHRRTLVCQDIPTAVAALRTRDPQRLLDGQPAASQRPVVFLCSGQGSQHLDMARELYLHQPVFRQQLDACAQSLRPLLGRDLIALLYPTPADRDSAAAQLLQTAIAQPALFAVEYALAQLWRHWGLRPQALIGHSLGEYVAATLAGVFTLDDALALVATRGRLMQAMPPGAMLSVALPEPELLAALSAHGDPSLGLATVNGPRQCVVSGPSAAIAALEAQLTAQGHPCRLLHTSHAFHSAMMEPMLAEFTAAVAAVPRQAPKLPLVSNLTGTWLTAEQAQDPGYWAQQLRQPVRFDAGLRTLLEAPERVLLEIGPGSALSSFARQQPGGAEAFASLRHPQDKRGDQEVLLSVTGRLWLAGVELDWERLQPGGRRQRLPLPTYPFEHKRYWIDPPALPQVISSPQQTLDKRTDIAEWFYLPAWQRAALAEQERAGAAESKHWLLFSDSCGVGEALAERLRQAGQRVTSVVAGDGLRQIAQDAYSLQPDQPDDYVALLSQLAEPAQAIVQLWSVSEEAGAPLSAQSFAEAQPACFYSLVYLIRALAQRPASGDLDIMVVSNQVQSVTGGERLSPEKATLLGPCLVIPQELPHITCRSVDIELAAPQTAEGERLASQLLAEGLTPGAQNLIAYRAGERWVQQFTPTRIEQATTPPLRLRQDGVYLITGGLGSIGLILAEYLARSVKARLVLTARTALPPREQWQRWLDEHEPEEPVSRKLRAIQALEQLGSEVLVLSADAASLPQMRGVVAETIGRFGAIHGAIHAAGIIADSTFKATQEITQEDCEAHFQSKVHGLLVLHEVLSGHALDFGLLMSSLSSVLGGFGYVAYAAANIFLDAFAHQQNRLEGTRWISADWDSWHYNWEAEHSGNVGATLSKLAITPPEGAEAFARILSLQDATQVVVSTSDLQARLDQWVQLRSLRELSASTAQSGAALSHYSSRAELEQRIAGIWQRVLGIGHVGMGDNFFDLGGNSLSGMQLIAELKRELNVQLSPVSLFEAPTVGALAASLMPEAGAGGAPLAARPQAGGSREIAIVGMAGRFPGAGSLDEFWRNLCAGSETISFFSDEELRAAGVDDQLIDDPSYVKARPILADAESFDAAFFGYSPREAELMDPQHRVLLECAWEALEHAGYIPDAYPGPVGVFAGSSLSTYLLNLYSNPELMQSIDPLQTVVGNAQDSLATTISYKLNLKGPSLSVQTFCSTSLVALHLACQSLLQGECALALAGGVSILVPQTSGYRYQPDSILSPDGHCRPFDAQAQGTLFGNGVGMVAVKRLADAIADGDSIYAVIKGTAINNDGSLKVGYTAPSVEGQAAVIGDALAIAGTPAESISYIEAHGTGTALGDPIELAALSRAFRASTDRAGFCALGSVKGNVGHLDRAAGVASLIKTALALHHRQLPASLQFSSPNPRIDFASSPFYVNTSLRDWSPPEGLPRRAGVSSLGFGGTNAHVILEEAPELAPGDPASGAQLLLLSANSPAALERMTDRLAEALAARPELSLADVAFTLQTGRKALPYRRALLCQDSSEAVAALRARDPQRLLAMPEQSGQAAELSLAIAAPQGSTPLHNQPAELGAAIAALSGADAGQIEPALGVIGRAWLAGASISWPELYAGQRRRRIALPAYPFERQRYWIEANTVAISGSRASGNGRRSQPADWLYLPSWRRAAPLPAPAEAAAPGHWLLFVDESGLGAALVSALKRAGHAVTSVGAGAAFEQHGPDSYMVNPRRRADYVALFEQLRGLGRPIETVLHLWGLEGARTNDASLLHLAEQLGAHARQPRLWVVASSLHEIGGDEPLAPAGATLLAQCDMLWQAYPQIACRLIDLPAAHSSRLLGQLMAELAAQDPERVVAYRGQHRWLPSVEPLGAAQGAPAAAAAQPGAGRVALLTSALAGPSYTFAKLLAQAGQARLALVEPERLPPRAEWQAALPEQAGAIAAEQIDLGERRDNSAQERPGPVALELAREQAALELAASTLERSLPTAASLAELEAASDQLCASYICDYLRSNGISLALGASYDREQLREQLGILPRFTRLYDFMLSVLAQDRILAIDGQRLVVLERVEQRASPPALSAALRERYPESAAGFEALEHCVRHYNQVLSGKVEAISVLYPGGDPEMMRSLERNQLRFSNLPVCRALLAELLGGVAGQSPAQRLRVLEVGAGDGAITWEVAARLKGSAHEYYVTDIGQSFVLNAEKRAAREQLDFIQCGVLDIARDPGAQGYQPYSFDIIIAAEVIHATSSVDTSMANLRRLLAPGGLLVVLEATRAQRWASMVWGLLDGWWSFVDRPLRSSSPLLSSQSWREAFERHGFVGSWSYPHGGEQQADYALIAGQQPATLDTPDYREWRAQQGDAAHGLLQRRLQRLHELEQLGAEVLVINADSTDEQQLRTAISLVEQRFGPLQGVIYGADQGRGGQEQTPARAALPAAAETRLLLQELQALSGALRERALEFTLAVSGLAPLSDEPGRLDQLTAQHLLEVFASLSQRDERPHWTALAWDGSRIDDEQSARVFALLCADGRQPAQLLVSPRRLDQAAERWNRLAVAEAGAPARASQRMHPRPALPTPYVAPGSQAEQQLAAIWSDILGIEQIGIHDSFLDFGGDSLQATQLTSRIREAFQVDLPLRSFFETPTIAGIVAAIDKLQAEQAEQAGYDAMEILRMIEQLSEDAVADELQRRKAGV